MIFPLFQLVFRAVFKARGEKKKKGGGGEETLFSMIKHFFFDINRA